MTDLPAVALVCPRHPDREGVGICVACKRIVCGDCATRLDGINHCRECLQRKIDAAKPSSSAAWRAIEKVMAGMVVAGAVLGLFFAYTGLGYAASDADWFGSGLSDTARALDESIDALRRFKADTKGYPSERQGLRALVVQDPLPDEGPIQGWRGPYLRPRKGADTDEALLKDGYGSRLRYVTGPGRPRPAVLSIGANRELETDTSALRHDDSASGDDRIRWVK